MKLLQYLLIVILISSNCNKSSVKGDLSGKEYIRGRLFLTDTLTQHVIGYPLTGKIVDISYANVTDTLNYLFSTKTDDQGYFIFQNLKKDQEYKVYYEERINGIYFSGRSVSKTSNDTLRLNASLSVKKQNGLIFSISDTSGGALKGTKLCIFSNKSAYLSGNCDIANYSLTTDEAGHAFKIDIPKGTYFILASTKLNTANYLVKDTITVGDTIVFKKLTLKKNEPPGFAIIAVDELGSRIGGANFCIFTSSILYRDTCEGSSFQVLADINGRAEKIDLQPGRYFIYGHFTQSKVIYSAKDTIDIENTSVVDTMIFNKKY